MYARASIIWPISDNRNFVSFWFAKSSLFYNLAQTATLARPPLVLIKSNLKLIDNSRLATSFHIARKFYPARNVVSENRNEKKKTKT